jgi:hypothetical protein
MPARMPARTTATALTALLREAGMAWVPHAEKVSHFCDQFSAESARPSMSYARLCMNHTTKRGFLVLKGGNLQKNQELLVKDCEGKPL